MKSSIKVLIGILITLFIISGFLYYFSQNDMFGWRFNFQLQQVEIKEYKGLAPNIKFEYSTIFEIDGDIQNKYGEGYVVGIKLKTDNRTGCDVRIDGPKLDYSKKIDELAQEITGEMSKNAKDFKIISKEKVLIDGKDAFKVSFSFLDPIGARVQLEQVFVSNNNLNYFMICGTGEQQYDFFRKDFEAFFNSIDFNVNESDFIK
ncbi:MAG: PsbP-related protein [Candidatus Moraniibacteriota bacterium]|jgi:photosystem II reaction center protein PsbP